MNQTLDASVVFVINGQKKQYSRGETYLIPGGTAHAAQFSPDYRGVEYFADVDRYHPRSKG